MRVVYSWLKDFVDIDVPVSELADALTSAGLEVASIQQYHIPDGVKVARVLHTEKHPNADRLSVCKVDAGEQEPLTIVCGAPNVRAEMTVALASIGTVLGEDFRIKKSKIRGVESFGMLCSEEELGLSQNHDGIIDLPSDFKVGEALSTYFGDDAVIEIEITPDRGDCLSVLGVAREVAANFGLPLKNNANVPVETEGLRIEDYISISIEAADRCPRYCGRLIKGVQIKPSPDWMQRRLTLGGIRPINNVVDVTNYMLLQYGQPMHAFDYASLQHKKIIVKRAGKNFTFNTLDEIKRELIAEDLLICDGDQPAALAGIMGGAGSEILDSTTDVFLECAFFEQTGIRKTSKRLGLSTDSSYRFERGVDPDRGLVDSIDTAAQLILETAGGQIAIGRIDEYPKAFSPRTIIIRTSKASRVLGVALGSEQIFSFLTSLGFKCTTESPDQISCVVPLFRHDITIEEDLIEEIGRMYGYDNIVPSGAAIVDLNMSLPLRERITDKLRTALAFFGLREIVTNSMTSEKLRSLLTPQVLPVVLLNPLNPEMAQMRTTLAGSMLGVLAYNLNRKNLNNHFFEFGKIFEQTNSGTVERQVIGILIEGNYWASSWSTAALPCSYYILKGIIEAFGAHCGVGEFTFKPAADSASIWEKEAALVSNGTVKGIAGKVSERICDHFDIKSFVYYAELDVTSLLQSSLPQPRYRQLPRFPALERDFCFVMADKLMASEIISEIYTVSSLIEEVTPFDLYRGEKLGEGSKSIAFSVKLRSVEKTLTDKEAEGICSAIVSTVQSKFGAQLRT